MNTTRRSSTRRNVLLASLAFVLFVVSPLALVAFPAREVARERERIEQLRARIAERRVDGPARAELERRAARITELEAALDARAESPLATRVLAQVFARDAGVALDALEPAEGDVTFVARGRATAGAWSRWLAELAQHGLAPHVVDYRLARASASDTSFEGTFTLAFETPARETGSAPRSDAAAARVRAGEREGTPLEARSRGVRAPSARDTVSGEPR